MVIHAFYQQLLSHAILAQQPTRPVLERLDPPRRAIVLMAILGLVLTGLMLVAGAMIGARWVRRMARQKPRSSQSTGGSSMRLDSLRESLHDVLPNVETGSTVQIDAASKDTKIDRRMKPESNS
ncbi:MAG: hypothetical protein WD669_06895 [Pirellulales bacterium]